MDLRKIDFIFITFFIILTIAIYTNAQNEIKYGESGILSEVSCQGNTISAKITNFQDKEMDLTTQSHESDLHIQVKGINMQEFICDKTTLSPGESTFCSDLIGNPDQKEQMIKIGEMVEIAAWFMDDHSNRGTVKVTCSEQDIAAAAEPAYVPEMPETPKAAFKVKQPVDIPSEPVELIEPSDAYYGTVVTLGFGFGLIVFIILLLILAAYLKHPILRYRHICPMDHSIMKSAGKVKIGPKGGYRTVYLCPKCNYKTIAGEKLTDGKHSRECPLCHSRLKKDGEIRVGPKGGKRRIYVCTKCKYRTMMDEKLSGKDIKDIHKKSSKKTK